MESPKVNKTKQYRKKGYRNPSVWTFYGADFETYTGDCDLNKGKPKSEMKAGVYAVGSKWIPVVWDTEKKSRYKKLDKDVYIKNPLNPNVFNRDYAIKNDLFYKGTKITEWLKWQVDVDCPDDSYLWKPQFRRDNNKGLKQCIFFHYGMNFDFHFIVPVLRKLNIPETFGIKKKEEQFRKQHLPYFTWLEGTGAGHICILNVNIPVLTKWTDKDTGEEKIKKNYVEMKFLDSYKFFSAELKKLAEDLNDKFHIEVPNKPEFDMNQVSQVYETFEELPLDVQERLTLDVIILCEYLTLMIPSDFFNEGTELKLTSPSITQAHFWQQELLPYWKEHNPGKKKPKWDELKNLLYYRLNILTPEDLSWKDYWNNYLMSKAGRKKRYAGGITTFQYHLRGQIIRNVLSLDVNSLYPTIMCMLLPGKYVDIEVRNYQHAKELSSKYFIFCEGVWEQVEQINKEVVPFLRKKWCIDEIGNNVEDEHYAHYLPKMEFFMSWKEYQLYKEGRHFKIGKELEIKFFCFEYTDFLKKWNERHYQERLDAKDRHDELMSTIKKLLLNCLYGKFGQNITRETRILKELFTPELKEMLEADGYDFSNHNTHEYDFEEDEDGEMIWEAPGSYVIGEYEKEGQLVYGPLACAITSLARAYIMDLSFKIGRTIYTDTDSIKIPNVTDIEEIRKLLPEGMIHKSKLGALKKDGEWPYMQIYKNKFYLCSNDGVTIDWDNSATSGIKKKELEDFRDKNGNPLTLKTDLSNPIVCFTNRPYKFEDGIIILKTNITILKGLTWYKKN